MISKEELQKVCARKKLFVLRPRAKKVILLYTEKKISFADEYLDKKNKLTKYKLTSENLLLLKLRSEKEVKSYLSNKAQWKRKLFCVELWLNVHEHKKDKVLLWTGVLMQYAEYPQRNKLRNEWKQNENNEKLSTIKQAYLVKEEKSLDAFKMS